MRRLLSLVKYCGVTLIGSLISSKISVNLAMGFASSRLARIRILRILLDYSLPVSKTEYSSIPVIVMIPVSTKDFHQIATVIKSICTHSVNPIKEIVVISPVKIDLLSEIVSPYPVSIIDESIMISPAFQNVISSLVPIGRTGWVIQQLIKLKFAGQSEYPVVILDADTVFLRDILFVDRFGRQLIQFSYESHAVYEEHYRNFMGSRYKGSTCHLSFVTHYQVMQNDVVLQFLGAIDENDLDIKLIDWLKCADFKNHSPLSEYHSYGRFLTEFHPSRCRIEGWRNFDSRDHKRPSKRTLALLNCRSYSMHITS